MKTAQDWIKKLKLQAHPEGGYYKEIYRSTEEIEGDLIPGNRKGKRSVSTAIYFLLDGNDFSAFHRIKSDEIWHFYDGECIILYVIDEVGKLCKYFLDRKNPMQVIPKNYWFSAELKNKNSYGLVGCTVAPGFDFEDFEMGERGDLIKEFPQHNDLITQLTKSQ